MGKINPYIISKLAGKEKLSGRMDRDYERSGYDMDYRRNYNRDYDMRYDNGYDRRYDYDRSYERYPEHNPRYEHNRQYNMPYPAAEKTHNRVGYESEQPYDRPRYSMGNETARAVGFGEYPNKQNDRLTEESARRWVRSMKHSDGSTGEYFTMEQAKEWMTKHSVSLPLPDFYAIMNAMKSDYCMVAKKFNINTEEFYGEMAKAFIEDKDAHPNKAAIYMNCIAAY